MNTDTGQRPTTQAKLKLRDRCEPQQLKAYMYVTTVVFVILFLDLDLGTNGI